MVNSDPPGKSLWVQAGYRQAQANSYIFTRPAQHDMGRTCVVFL